MPLPLAGWLIGSAIASGAGSIFGAHKQSKAADKASAREASANAEALAFEREKEAQRRTEWDAQEAARKLAWDTEQANQFESAMRREPLRRAKYDAYRSLAQSIGIQMPDFVPYERPRPVAQNNIANTAAPLAPQQPAAPPPQKLAGATTWTRPQLVSSAMPMPNAPLAQPSEQPMSAAISYRRPQRSL